MITETGLKRGITLLSLIAFFPGEEDKRSAIMETLGAICRDDEQIEWLTKRAGLLHGEWSKCGIRGLWQIWFAKHRPRNEEELALELLVGSTDAYPDGVPSEQPIPSLLIGEHGTYVALPGNISADPEMDSLVKRLSAGKKLVED